MESATLCWILDDEDATSNPENTENIEKEVEKKTIATQTNEYKLEHNLGAMRRISSTDSMEAIRRISSTDNLELPADDDSCDGMNDGPSSMKTIIADEQHRTKKSSYTLTDINFKIKKGTRLNPEN